MLVLRAAQRKNRLLPKNESGDFDRVCYLLADK